MSFPEKDSQFYEDSKYVKMIDIRTDLGMTNRKFWKKIWDRALQVWVLRVWIRDGIPNCILYVTLVTGLAATDADYIYRVYFQRDFQRYPVDIGMIKSAAWFMGFPKKFYDEPYVSAIRNAWRSSQLDETTSKDDIARFMMNVYYLALLPNPADAHTGAI